MSEILPQEACQELSLKAVEGSLMEIKKGYLVTIFKDLVPEI